MSRLNIMKTKLKDALQQALPRSIRPRRILGGPLSGSWIVTSWRDYPAAILGYTEIPLLDWFATSVRAGETWLDVGAHYGYTAIALCRLVGDTGRVYAFEPQVASAGCLGQTRALNRLRQLTVIPLALGGLDELSIQSLPETRGMVDSTVAENSALVPFLAANFDWLWPRICGWQKQIDGVKIDVQGMEIEVLKGMTSILRGYRPKLAIEFHKGVPRKDLLTLLAAMNYSQPGLPVDPLPGESTPLYVDDRSYAFFPDEQAAYAKSIGPE
jgi:FkbM family methyltransferase